MSERMLITKLVRDGDRADLYAKGHRWPDLKLFDLSDLADVGIDYATLETGEETPCRFWAIWDLSEKTNSAGNPYKDVVALEPIDAPATTSSVDTSALLSELRAIRALLEVLVDPASKASWPEPLSGPEWETFDEEDEPGDQEPEPEEPPAPEPSATPDLDREFGPRNGSPMTAQALLEILKAQGIAYQSVGHLLYGIRKAAENDHYQVDWTTKDGQREALKLAQSYGKTI